MEFNTGGTADSSNSGAMTGGTMASSMYKNGGGVGRFKVGVFNEQQLRNKEDKKAVEKAQRQTGLKYVDTKMIKKGGKMYLEVYLIPNEEYYESSKFANGGRLKPIPKGNKGLPKLPESVRNKMGYMAKGGGVEDLDYKAKKFLETIRIADNKIQLKDVTVHSTPKGNWAVYWKDKSLMTVQGYLLDDDTIMKYNLEHQKMAKGGGTKKNITTKKTKTMDKKWSKKIDKAIKAKKPGFRKSPGGGYYEYRSNRSDVNPKMKLEWGGTAESSETGEPIGGENQSSMFSEGGNIGGFTYSIGGL